MTAAANKTKTRSDQEIEVALLTGGGDRPYAFGLATALISSGVRLDLIGSDELDAPEFHNTPSVNFLNLRGSTRPDATWPTKISRVMIYYSRLIRYALTARPKVFHILWNNKFEVFDRTFLMALYRFLGRKVILTVHNVNAGIRDSTDSDLNRLTLKIQYRLAHHIFVHTEKMKTALTSSFGIREAAVTVIPFGINNAVPHTALTPSAAKRRLGIRDDERTILFFGNIAPYKGLEYLVAAFQRILAKRDDYRLLIVGRPRGSESYWNAIQHTIQQHIEPTRIIRRIEYVADDETELFFKAADVLILPYVEIFQSGVLFLGYSFGLPVIAADVGSLRDEVVEGETGFVCAPRDSVDLAKAIETYFSSDLYSSLTHRRHMIREYADERHSWAKVSQMTRNQYAELLVNR